VTGQIVGRKVLPFSDHEAVRRALAQWKFSNPQGERIMGTLTYRTNTR